MLSAPNMCDTAHPVNRPSLRPCSLPADTHLCSFEAKFPGELSLLLLPAPHASPPSSPETRSQVVTPLPLVPRVPPLLNCLSYRLILLSPFQDSSLELSLALVHPRAPLEDDPFSSLAPRCPSGPGSGLRAPAQYSLVNSSF